MKKGYAKSHYLMVSSVVLCWGRMCIVEGAKNSFTADQNPPPLPWGSWPCT